MNRSNRFSVLRPTLRVRACLAAFLVAALLSGPAFAGGATYCVNCSTNYTQLSQYAKDIQGVIEQAQTVQNTLQSSMYLGQSLQQLDPTTLAGLSGNPLSSVQGLAAQYNTLGGLTSSYNGLLSQMTAFQTGAQQNNMTPNQYLQFQATQARAGNTQYQQQIKMEQQAITNANQESAQLQLETAKSATVTSPVNGMQQLLASNVKTQQLLVTLNKNMEIANLNAAQAGSAANGNKAADAASEQQALALQNQLQQVQYTLPSNGSLGASSNAAQVATFTPPVPTSPPGSGG